MWALVRRYQQLPTLLFGSVWESRLERPLGQRLAEPSPMTPAPMPMATRIDTSAMTDWPSTLSDERVTGGIWVGWHSTAVDFEIVDPIGPP